MSLTRSLDNVVIDCQGSSYAFKVFGSFFSLRQITIQNCYGSLGGAIQLQNSQAMIVNCSFNANFATQGGAIYSNDSTLHVYSSLFTNNVAIQYGPIIYSLGSTVSINGDNNSMVNNSFYQGVVGFIDCSAESTISVGSSEILLPESDNIYFNCYDSCTSTYLARSLCNPGPAIIQYNDGAEVPTLKDANTEQKTDLHALHSTQSLQLQVYFTGMQFPELDPNYDGYKFQNSQLQTTGTATNERRGGGGDGSMLGMFQLSNIQIDQFMVGYKEVVGAALTGYLQVETSKYLVFNFTGSSHVSISVWVNGMVVLELSEPQTQTPTNPIFFTTGVTHYIVIKIESIHDSPQRSFKLQPFPSGEKFFVSMNLCDDHIPNIRHDAVKCPVQEELCTYI
ncbi:hypothetical protein SAMD00019534_125180 [Acytostelium subglobosum LB1]|uniref:hypothetical protein n=1 Tax=Acytostelium subglobosum LB1 TaxID=1410327 RepID=UPI000644806A|nr:hypothetical protein SAMD00019534_125180 [Acytostelium subglobosum LB1]GAM29342.1 hypothetical protein SAMD00019534_125180 [Acytostelium subglobosum LB1]|eukprot:XP_012747722.1 hypothetical protein SAMD00019534_125180 [Acytostelium subglobosum LB1]